MFMFGLLSFYLKWDAISFYVYLILLHFILDEM